MLQLDVVEFHFQVYRNQVLFTQLITTTSAIHIIHGWQLDDHHITDHSPSRTRWWFFSSTKKNESPLGSSQSSCLELAVADPWQLPAEAKRSGPHLCWPDGLQLFPWISMDKLLTSQTLMITRMIFRSMWEALQVISETIGGSYWSGDPRWSWSCSGRCSWHHGDPLKTEIGKWWENDTVFKTEILHIWLQYFVQLYVAATSCGVMPHLAMW